jgi:hypothetical protein
VIALLAQEGKPPVTRPPWAQCIAGVTLTVALAVLAQVCQSVFIVAVAALGVLAAAVWLGLAKSSTFSALLVIGFSIQPMLKFYVSPYFGPAKDALAVVAIAVLCVTLYLRGYPARRDRWIPYHAIALGALFMVNVAGDHDAAWAAAARLCVEAIGLFLVGYLGRRARTRWTAVYNSLIVVGCVEATLGLAQQVLGTRALVTDFGLAFGEQVRETAGGQLRSFGTFDDPFSYAGVLLLALVVATQMRPGHRSTLVVGLLLSLGVYVSHDRTAVVLLLAVIGLWIWRLGHRTSVVLLGTAFVGAGILVIASLGALSAPAGGADPLTTLTSLNGRTVLWGQVIGDPWHLVAGRGVGAVGTGLARSQSGLIVEQQTYVPGQAPAVADLSKLYSVDNSYLAVVADVGVPGVLLLIAIGWMLVHIARSPQRCDALRYSIFGLVGVVAVDAFTRSSLFAFPFGFIAMYVIGTASAALLDAGGDFPRRRDEASAV